MWSYINSINLIRYLLVWRVNSSLVWVPRCLAAELSPVLGTIISKRLPTSEARYWRKALAPYDEYHGEGSDKGNKNSNKIPEASWPIEAVLFVYPGKRTYGIGEFIMWELKLIGESADHGFFLEVILPAMEEAGYTSEPQWNRPNTLWGKFDIHSVYVARGSNWEPLVTDSRLDLRYRASPIQWAEGLTFGEKLKFDNPTHLTWLTPFDLDVGGSGNEAIRQGKSNDRKIPTLKDILEALVFRINLLVPRMEEELPIQGAMEQADNVSILYKNIKAAPKGWTGRWVGTQIFSYIPFSAIPYLELASILHVGKQTHFGCGTFVLIRSTKQ